jgi:hypothetical protein
VTANNVAIYPQAGQVLIQQQVLTAPQASVTFAVPQNFRQLRMIIQCGSTGSYPYGEMQFNGDAVSGHYSWSWIFWNNGAQAQGNSSDDAAVSFNCGLNSGAFAVTDLTIYNYTSALNKLMVATAYDAVGNTTDTIGAGWNEAAAINTIELLPNGGNFMTGSTFTLYGVS